MDGTSKQTPYQLPLVSVIIPVYRCRDTLQKAAESVLGQNYEKLELLLVPNGEDTDGSGQVCRHLAEKDRRVRVISCAEKGASAARNEGIRQAKGGLIRFLDSDDTMVKGSLLPMVRTLQRDQSDLVIGGYRHLYFGSRVLKNVHQNAVVDPRRDREDMKRLYEEGFLNMPWNKLYVKEKIKSFFPQDLSLGEDLCFNQDYISRVQRISLLQMPVCEYLQNERQTTLSGGFRQDRIRVCLRLYGESHRFFSKLWELPKESGSALSFLDEKVVGTFLDDLGLLGVSASDRELREAVDNYVAAIRRFTERGRKKIRLKLPDHRILYRAAVCNQKSLLRQLLRIRGALVRMKRRHAANDT